MRLPTIVEMDYMYLHMPVLRIILGIGMLTCCLSSEETSASGFTVDTMGMGCGQEKEDIRQKIRDGFRIEEHRPCRDIPCLLQIELECSPRSI